MVISTDESGPSFEGDASFSERHTPGTDGPILEPPIKHDAEGRLPAGSLPGWGLSWWLHEQGLLAGCDRLSMSERLDRVNDYWRAVADGWWPPVAPEDWVGPCHPWAPEA
jgi:hypothetical protein